MDATARSVRYAATPDGGGVFSARLGNPGSAAIRRLAWEANSAVGYPDTPCEDLDYCRLLLSDAPTLAPSRPRRCSHVLIDMAELRRQGRGVASGFMTVRLIGHSHVWPLPSLCQKGALSNAEGATLPALDQLADGDLPQAIREALSTAFPKKPAEKLGEWAKVCAQAGSVTSK